MAAIRNIEWFKISKHEKCGTHAVWLAVWHSARRVRHVTHILPMEQQEALGAHFGLIYRVLKCYGMCGDVAGDAEAVTLNGVNLFKAYRFHWLVAFGALRGLEVWMEEDLGTLELWLRGIKQ